VEEKVDEEVQEVEVEFAEWVEELEVEVEEAPGGDRFHVLVCQHSQDGAVVVLHPVLWRRPFPGGRHAALTP